MVPGAYVRLERLPLTPNGKLDRRSLPAPEGDAYAVLEYEEPVGEIERAVAEVWAELLGVERVGRRDDFFRLGGHSLLVIVVIERLKRQGLHLDVGAFFATPTPSGLAASINAQSSTIEIPPNRIPVRNKQETDPSEKLELRI
jgi:aryl carrier-like protein